MQNKKDAHQMLHQEHRLHQLYANLFIKFIIIKICHQKKYKIFEYFKIKCNKILTYNSIDFCGIINSTTGPFASCLKVKQKISINMS
jgi:hypothetical protein